MVLAIACWIATIGVLCSYAWMVRTGKQNQFNMVNVLGSVPLTAAALVAGLFANALLSLAFGVIGLLGLYNAYIDGRLSE